MLYSVIEKREVSSFGLKLNAFNYIGCLKSILQILFMLIDKITSKNVLSEQIEAIVFMLRNEISGLLSFY